MGILFTGIVPEPFQGVYENIGGKSSRFRDNDGSSNAPATFQRLMDKVLRGLTWHQCLVYIDDVLIFAITFKAHLVNLDFSALTANQGGRVETKTIQVQVWRQSGGDYLGFSISDEGLQPARKKVEALLKVSPPKHEQGANQFSVVCKFYYRNEIPRFGELTVELFELAHSKKRLCVCNDKLLNSFKELQCNAMANSPILAFTNFDLPFIIQGDAVL